MITEIIIAGCSVLTIVLSLSGILGKKFDKIERRFDKIDGKFEDIHTDLKDIQKDLRQIDSRMSRLEGSFIERGYWESRDKKIGE